MVNNEVKKELEYRELEEDMSLLEEKYSRLVRERGIVLLDHMSDERLKRVMALLRDFPDVRGYTVLEGEEKRLVLKYMGNHLVEDVNAHNEAGYQAFKAKDYDRAIEEYKTVLSGTTFSKAFVYDMIGRSYLAKKQPDKAIDYLVVATYNSSKENGKRKIDHSRFISDYYNRKFSVGTPRVNNYNKDKNLFYHREFSKDEEYDFGIKDLAAMRDYAAINNMSIEEVGVKLGLSCEERDLVKLICARDLYKQGMIDEGNVFLNAVDGTKKKTPLVMAFMNEVREKKNFYQYRGEKPRTLTYLKPGKREY